MKRFADLLVDLRERSEASSSVGRRSSDLYNPPGRRELDYRAGTFPSFLAEMLEALPEATVPDRDFAEAYPLARLDLTERGNWVTALLAAWAAAADVLTFYQERIVNEGFLRTASEERSARELALQVGYVPDPGVAGSALLAFTVLAGEGLPKRSLVPIGTRTMSLPLDGQLPQVFETDADLDARAVWNRLVPLGKVARTPQVLGPGTAEVRVAGMPVGLSPGGALVVADDEGVRGRWVRIVGGVEPVPGTSPGELSMRVRFAEPLAGDRPLAAPLLVSLPQRAALFGHNAPPWAGLPDERKRDLSPALGGVAVSVDRGTTRTDGNLGLPAKPITVLAVAEDGTLYAVAGDPVLYRSLDFGASWQIAGRLAAPPLCLLVGPSGHLFAGTATGVLRSTDRGVTWQPVAADPASRRPWSRRLADRLASRRRTARLPETPVRALCVTTWDGRSLLWAGTDVGVFRSALPSVGWDAISAGLPGADAETGQAQVVVYGLAPGRRRRDLLAATEVGVFRTRNRGRRWRAASFGLPGRQPWTGRTDAPVHAVAALPDPRTGRPVLVAGTAHGPFRSTDGGGRWHAAGRGLPGADALGEAPVAVTSLAAAADPATRETALYAATPAGLFRSLDFAGSWQEVATGAPDPRVLAVAAAAPNRLAVATAFAGFADRDWPGFHLRGREIDLAGVVPEAVAGGWVALVEGAGGGEPAAGARSGVYRILRAQTVRRSDFDLTGVVTRLEVDRDPSSAVDLADFDLRSTVAYLASVHLTLWVDTSPIPTALDPRRVVVPAALPEDLPARRPVLVSGKAIGPVVADGAVNGPFEATSPRAGAGGETIVDLVPAGGGFSPRIGRPISGLTFAPPAADAPRLVFPATAERLKVAEIPPLAAAHGLARHEIGVLALDPPPILLAADTVEILGNVSRATQGETAPDEVLGSGDATRTFQRFLLRKPPLTWVRDRDTGEVRSTLEIRLQSTSRREEGALADRRTTGVAWREVGALYDAGPNDPVFMIRPDREGNPMVVFGDGVHGARLPTGTENVYAFYRSGLWTAPVPADHLSLLQTRPVGLAGVTNPLPATPGAPPAGAKALRRRVPRSLRTLGRLVSLSDYEDFARASAGVADARATALATAEGPVVQVTVIGAEGRELGAGDGLLEGLAAAVRSAGAGSRSVQFAGGRRVRLRIAAGLRIDRRRRPADVAEAARAALAAAFGGGAALLGRSRLARPLPASEVLARLHRVEGVVGVDLTVCRREDGEEPFVALVPAAPARTEGGVVRPAEYLVLDDPEVTVVP